jgi:AraC family transcriptional regulator
VPESEPKLRVENFKRLDSSELKLVQEDITAETCWQIHDRRHTVVVHLAGEMERLTTQIDGLESRRFPARPGEIWIIPAGRSYQGLARGGSIRYLELKLEPDFGLVDCELSSLSLEPRSAVRDALLVSNLKNLASLTKVDDAVSILYGQSLAQTVQLHLLRNYASKPSLKTPKRTICLERHQRTILQDFIQENLENKILLDSLANQVGLSVHHLLVAFRREFGTTPAQYVLDRRLEKAKSLLAGSDDITAVAISTGFASHSHFTTAFKTRFGLTPNQYRRQMPT